VSRAAAAPVLSSARREIGFGARDIANDTAPATAATSTFQAL
jgi:hypothetical protein